MTDFESVDSSRVCYANQTHFITYRFKNYENLATLLEFSALINAIFILFLLLCVVKLRKQKNCVTEENSIPDEPSTESTKPEVRESYPRLGRFLSLITIKL